MTTGGGAGEVDAAAAGGRPAASLLGLRAPAVRFVVRMGYVAVLAGMIAARLLVPDTRSSLVIEQVIWSVVGALTAVVLAAAWYRASGLEARVWGVIATATFLLLAGQASYGFASAAGSVIDLTSVAPTVAFDVLAGVLFLTMLAWLTRVGHASFFSRARFGIDVLAVAVIAAGLLGAYVIGPWFRSMGPTPLLTLALYSGSPVVGAMGLAGSGLVLIGVRWDRWEPWERLIAASVASLGIGLVLAPIGFADNRWGIAGGWASALVDVMWVTGVYAVGAAAIYRHLDRDRRWRVRPLAVLEPAYGWVPSVVLPAIEVVAVPLFAVTAMREPAGGRIDELALAGGIAVALAVRTLLSVADTSTLEAFSSTDPLTGLGTVRRFHEQLAGALVAAARYHQPVSVMVVDLDDFEHVNASGGFAIGDTTLVEFARRVVRAVRPQDVVCRIGGDEIAVILPATGPEDAADIAEAVLDEVRQVAEPGGMSLTASAGIASSPAHALESGELLERAEAARTWAESRGRDCAVVFDPAIGGSFDPVSRIRETEERADFETVRALAAAFEERDGAARDHSAAVSRNAVALARELELSDREVLVIEYAALLHDIGKIGLPDSVVRGGPALSPTESRALRDHPVLGEQMLASVHIREILPLVRHHHERWDGGGYPDALAGEQIPIGARIIALANAYDGMRRGAGGVALSRTAALQEIDLGLGTAFDPEIGDRFIGVIGRRYL